MSKRLQVILEDAEMREIQRAARQKRQTVAEWVRHALRQARRIEPAGDPARKIAAIRRAASDFRFPAGEIDEMLEQIEAGSRAGESE
ncbi:MAG TPA: antitoxin [Thermoanaerobaculia bacterium]|nr:antitoxin [Thermoanaerobaculia bacterium]